MKKNLFRTDEQISINYLLGRWESKTIVDVLDFDISFNMTDFSPSQKVILQILHVDNKSYSINVTVPAMNWSTNKTVELKLINGSLLLEKGILKITDFGDSRIYKMPIISADSGQLETYLFKTRVTFENINTG
jgi:hypothetical protein